MKNGPLHSEVYDLVKGEHADEAAWSNFMQKDRYELALRADPGMLELSKSEIETLNEVSDKFCTFTEWDLVELTHTFPEWLDCYVENTSQPIPFQRILDPVGLSGDDQAAILADLEEVAGMGFAPC